MTIQYYDLLLSLYFYDTQLLTLLLVTAYHANYYANNPPPLPPRLQRARPGLPSIASAKEGHFFAIPHNKSKYVT